MSSFIRQDLVPPHLGITRQPIVLRNVSSRDIGAILSHVSDNDVHALGVSLRLSPKDGTVDVVAFATSTHIFQVSLGDQTSLAGNRRVATGDSLSRLLGNVNCHLAAFDMARVALHLYKQCNVHVQGIDLSTLFSGLDGSPDTPAELAYKKVHPDVNRHRIHAAWYRDEVKDVCLRAWLSAVIAESSPDALDSASKVETTNLPDVHLQCLADLMTNIVLLEAERPTHIENDFEDVTLDEDGQLVITNERYSNRVRRSKQTSVILETAHGHRITGEAVRAEGKRTGVKVHGGNFRGGIERISVIGREEPTHAERARDGFILRLLQGAISSLTRSPFVRALWFPAPQPRVGRGSGDGEDAWSPQLAALNESQKAVVRAMWADDEPVVVVHGPPGTGKTRTIAVSLEEWDRCGEPAWVIAQSNVGVKNIARTLIKHNVDFKIIVSKEFYVEWHEHLYESIERRLIRADELIADPVEVERMIGGSTIILCTVSMLSNPGLDSCGIYRLAPVERLIVDEASQIDSFEFMHLFDKFHRLHKLCMFGDPKQLPPYGKETAPSMKTIFDFKHFKPTAYFLNTQYRMPVPLGEFISEEVYNSKLKSVHKINDDSCVRFVDVRKGAEESVGLSWKVRCCIVSFVFVANL
ncbi:P-loop containing nucleoside triphosphate hydrolase protein [Dichomitus squalens]|uniref:P-loop containing nucleoside triphosphate hydrolase protein n=1 Tax=Dichomitus squalens TaxID=114155 RepID=A0A4V2K8D5_9APHY|nr:P-loop containing nucleoside triphosphate hydrolase protein [Dichomitus squalens]